MYNPVYCLYETLKAIRKKNKSITNVYMYMRVIKLNSIYETASFVNIFKNNNNDRNSNNKTVNKNNADCCLTCFRLSSQAKLKNYIISCQQSLTQCTLALVYNITRCTLSLAVPYPMSKCTLPLGVPQPCPKRTHPLGVHVAKLHTCPTVLSIWRAYKYLLRHH